MVNGWLVAPAGIIIVSWLAVACVTLAFTGPTYTVLPVVLALKFAPLITTVLPIGPNEGEKLPIIGIWHSKDWQQKMAANESTVGKKCTALLKRMLLLNGKGVLDLSINNLLLMYGQGI